VQQGILEWFETMKHAFFIIGIVGFCLAAAADDDAENYVWDVAGGIKGTAPQVARQINAGLEAAWSHFADADASVHRAQADLDAQNAATLKALHESSAYKTKAAALTRAEADLKQARATGDPAQAIQIGATINQARSDLVAMEKSAITADIKLPALQADLNASIRKRTDARTAMNKAAEWRSRILHGIKFGEVLTLPLVHDQEFWIDSVRVHEANNITLTLEMKIQEEVPGSTKKNARGDGIDVAEYVDHPIHVIIPRPAKCTADAGSTVAIKAPYHLSGDFDNQGRLPTIHALPDRDGKLAVLLKAAAEIKGPDKAYLDGIDDAVDKKEAKALEELDRKRK
jgi:hypothetical protein